MNDFQARSVKTFAFACVTLTIHLLRIIAGVEQLISDHTRNHQLDKGVSAMKRCVATGCEWQRWPVETLFLVGVVLVAILSGTGQIAQAQGAGHYVLVKTVIDRNKQSGTQQGLASRTSLQMTNGSFEGDVQFLNDDGSLRYTIRKAWTFNTPPAQLGPGQEFTITATGSVSTTEQGGFAGTQFSCGGDITQGDNRAIARTDQQPQLTKTFRLKAPSGPASRSKFEINLEAEGLVNDYYYEWRAGSAAVRSRLSARLDCGTLEVVRNQNSETCHIIISGWRRDTAHRVEVVFPRQSDGSGSQDRGGRTGIVVPIGQGSEAPHNMSGSRGPDGSYGKSYSWTLFVRARGNAPVGTQSIPIIVRQQTGGQVRLAMKVRVLPGRSKQTGARRDGEGTVTGGSGGRPPITRSTSPTGLSARLGCSGTLVLVPGQESQSCTIFIKGWRTNTSDQVEVFLPQESKLRGNLGNDLVAFPGGGAMDPANMFRNGDGEFPYGIGFRAMERAPGGTTMIEIVVRQKGHQQVRLLLRVDVRRAGSTSRVTGGTSRASGGTTTSRPGGSGTGSGIRVIPNNPGGGSPFGQSEGDDVLATAMQLEEAGKWAEAEAEYRRVLRLHPKLDTGWNSLGEMCFKQGKWSEAENAYRQAVRLQPEEGFYRAQLANALLKQNRRDEAMKEAKEAIRLGVGDHEVLDELGLHTEATP
jgi:Tetratricopeptide repeat